MRGSNGFAQGYIDRLWTTDDPVGAVRAGGAQHAPASTGMRRRWHPAARARWRSSRGWSRGTPRTGARHNISAHYDLGNDLFAAFLDERLMYSCAYFPVSRR